MYPWYSMGLWYSMGIHYIHRIQCIYGIQCINGIHTYSHLTCEFRPLLSLYNSFFYPLEVVSCCPLFIDLGVDIGDWG